MKWNFDLLNNLRKSGEGYLPGWIPFKGGDYFIFFQPVFNISDASISVGVILILLFQKRFFKQQKITKEKKIA